MSATAAAAHADETEENAGAEGAATEHDAGRDERAQLETRARRQGWRPEAEYKGPTGTWKDAEEFLRDGEETLPFLRQRMHRVEQLAEKSEKQNAESLRVITDLTERLRKADERAYARAMRELEGRRAQAVENADKAAFDAAEREIKELRDADPAPRQPPQAAAPAPAQATVDPVVAAWGQRNQWFFADQELATEARIANDVLAHTRPDLTTADRLEMVTQRVKRLFPDKFGNTRREAPAAVSSASGESVRRQRGKSFDDMPKESKDAYARYAKSLAGKGKPLTKDEWAVDYWAQE